jgi:O-antigen ligase
MFFLVFITRAGCDPLFEAAKSAGGMGPGAAVNAFMLLLAGVCVLRRPRTPARFVLPMWSAFLLVAALSAAIAPAVSNALRLFLVQLSYCAVFSIAFYLVRSEHDVQPCLRAIVWSSLIPVAGGFLQIALQGGIPDGEEYRIKSTFSHANVFAFYLVLVMSVILYLHKAVHALQTTLVRTASWCYLAVLMALLVCTKTRSAWVGAFLVFAIYGLFHQRRFLLYVVAVPMLLLLDPAVRERVVDLGNNDVTKGAVNLNSYAWRVMLWQAGLHWMSKSHAVLGYGLDSFKFYSPQFFPLEGQDSWDPHNVYVQLFFETGAVGLLAYAWLFLRLFGHLLRSRTREHHVGGTILIAIVVSYLATSYSDNMLYYLSFNWYFWFLMGVACAAANLRRPRVTILPASPTWRPSRGRT